MEIIDILVPIALANLVSEQKIIRNLVLKVWKPENYLKWTGIKRWSFDLISCWTCLTVWTTLLYIILKQEPLGLQYIYQPLVNMLLVDIIQKIKR